MASSNVFISVSDIEAWFAIKKGPLEIQTYALQHCANCRPSVEPCPTCARSQEILRNDIEQWKDLEAREINLFNNPSNEHDPTEFQQLYAKKKTKFQERMGTREKANSWMGPAVESEHKELQGFDLREKANSWKGPTVESKQNQLKKWKEKLEDLDRWFDMEDEVLKAKGWL